MSMYAESSWWIIYCELRRCLLHRLSNEARKAPQQFRVSIVTGGKNVRKSGTCMRQMHVEIRVHQASWSVISPEKPVLLPWPSGRLVDERASSKPHISSKHGVDENTPSPQSISRHWHEVGGYLAGAM